MKKLNGINVNLHWSAPYLRKQLKGLRISRENLNRLQEQQKALQMLHYGGILSDSETRRGAKRICKSIWSMIPKTIKAKLQTKRETP